MKALYYSDTYRQCRVCHDEFEDSVGDGLCPVCAAVFEVIRLTTDVTCFTC